MEILHAEGCFVCNEVMGHFKSDLNIVTSYSEKTIYSLIEAFTGVILSEDVINECGICQNCLIKFNEYDELTTRAEKIQKDLVTLFDLALNEQQNTQMEEEEYIEEEKDIIKEDPEELVYEEYVLAKTEEEDFITETDEVIETIENEENDSAADNVEMVDLVEVGYLETEKLPRKYQNPEPKHKFIKSKSIKQESDDGFILVQLENNVKLFQCEICNRTFKEKSKLKSHRLIHTNERNIVCPTCGKAFKTQACLRSHKRVHNPVIIECDYCGKTYTQKPELIKHINFVHFNRRDFVCEVCNAGFGCKGHLKAHYLTHQQFRGISCEICGYSFHTQAKLQRHMKSHTGQRDYECGLCHKRFLYSYNVSAHIRHVHWKEKRKSDESTRTCNFCSKKFQKIWKLRDHLQQEHQYIETEIIDGSEIIDESNAELEEELTEA